MLHWSIDSIGRKVPHLNGIRGHFILRDDAEVVMLEHSRRGLLVSVLCWCCIGVCALVRCGGVGALGTRGHCRDALVHWCIAMLGTKRNV